MVFVKDLVLPNCLLYIMKNWKESSNQGVDFGPLLTDLPKAFDCMMHELL